MASPIQRRMFAALAGFALALCVAYTGLAIVIAYVAEDMLVDRLLEREAAALAAHHRAHGALPPAALTLDLIHVHRSAATLPPAVRARVAQGAARGEVFAGAGRHYHLRTVDVAGQPVHLVADAGPLLVVARLVQDVGGVLLAVAAGLVALALLLAWLLARRLVLPLQRLARDVRAVGELPAGGPAAFAAQRRDDEIGYLANRLADTLGALQAALRREQAFVRDVGHELRTPLTVLTNTLAAGPLDARAAGDLRAGVAELRETVDVLFALARAGHVPAETFDLRGALEQSLLRLADAGWDAGNLVLDVPERLAVAGNRQLALLLFHNCLGNAVFHGAGAPLRIAYAGGTLTIANAIDPARPAVTQGFRHGHDLLLRIAAALGWHVALQPGDAEYRVALVPLPGA